MSKDEYKEMMDKGREATDAALSSMESDSEEPAKPKPSAKDKIDAAW